MNKFALVLGLVLFPTALKAQMSYVEEAKTLGIIAGQGLACRASKYDKFEMLSRAIILTKAPNSSALQDGLYAYNSAKADTFLAKRKDGGYLCGQIVRQFDNQDIYNITLYEDGTLKMPDGEIITPKMPYDASKIYAVDQEQQNNIDEVYDESVEKVNQRRQKAQVNLPADNDSGDRSLNVQYMPEENVQTLDNDFAPESTIGHISRRNRY